MVERLNKPRIFLSHSKKDVDLIKRLCEDLRGCQIEPWLDEIDIRPGKPWLDAIFEEGIPTCDCVFIYLTEHSVNSAMVKKELDAAVLGQFDDNKMALLPHVSSQEVRAGLRADIRSLQIPVLHDGNYLQVLPKIVAEVWRSFLERTIELAVQRERVKRLEAELELERIRKASSDSVFTETEEREFAYIAKKLTREELVEFEEWRRIDNQKTQVLRVIRFNISVISLFSEITGSSWYEYSAYAVSSKIYQVLVGEIPDQELDNKKISISLIEGTLLSDLSDEFLKYGLLQRVVREAESSQLPGIIGSIRRRHSLHLDYTDRLERFKYWLSFNGMMPEKLSWSLIGIERVNDQSQISEA